jgi:4-diphosphocytidyl-2-C-methyl-D-erythritol kinase
MRIKSFAKINLGLEVLRKRDDGYHEVRTLFQTIDFWDLLEFLPVSGNRIVLKGNDKKISWDESNLIHRAACLLKERSGGTEGVAIHVTKNIPAGKGLGGGSSNAAMTLYALNLFWGLHLEKQSLMEMACALGADVPFFLEGGLCLGLGRGDQVIPLEEPEKFFCVLVFPALSVSTASAYRKLSVSLTSKPKDSKIIRFFGSRDFGLLENDFEEILFRDHPQLKAIKSLIQSQGSELSLVSGTGSCVFGLFLEKRKAEKALGLLARQDSVITTESLLRKGYWERIRSGV